MSITAGIENRFRTRALTGVLAGAVVGMTASLGAGTAAIAADR